MTEQLTVKIIAEQHPDIYRQIFEKGKADGEKAERDLFAELQKACGEDLELLVQCFSEGKTAEEAVYEAGSKNLRIKTLN